MWALEEEKSALAISYVRWPIGRLALPNAYGRNERARLALHIQEWLAIPSSRNCTNRSIESFTVDFILVFQYGASSFRRTWCSK